MNPSQPDFFAKPVFALYAWLGGEGLKANYEPYDVMHVTDDEWERYLDSPNPPFLSLDSLAISHRYL